MSEFENLFHDYAPVIYRFLLTLCRDKDLAEELTSETLYQAYLHIGQFRGECKIETWLCQIAKNALNKELKRRGRNLQLQDAEICEKTESWAKVTFYRAKEKLIKSMEGTK